jgi:hypothetical protein
LLAGWLSPAVVFAENDAEFFEKKIRPLLVERCEICHSAAKGKTSGGLALDTREGWQKGGDSGGAVIVPGKPEESLLIKAVRYVDDGPQMPPKEKGGKLTDGEIAAIVEWVSRGAHDPRVPTARIGGMTPDEARTWWSFQKVRPTNPPAVKDTARPRTEIDAFILAKLEEQGIAPAGPADRRTLLRRATFDLTGLPPTPAELEAFVNDPSDNAFARVVDRLLGSPAYGQRWARHWLDVARYADFYDANPQTRTASCEITEAWRYRDWVVDALNSDLPYDQFIVHQIAGDQLPSPDGEEIYPAGLIATTFLTNGVWDRGDADKEKIVSDMADDNIDTVGKAFLGLTLGCARCHDHKFDPILTEDYYALAGMFYSSHILADLGAKGAEYVMNRTPLVPPAVAAKRDAQVKQIADFNAKITELDKKSPRTPEEDATRTQLIQQRDKLQGELPPEPPLAIAMREGGQPGGLFPGIQDVPIHIRGSYIKLGPVVPRRMPKFLAGDAQSPIAAGSGRKELAHWVASKDNPLTARVMVNRLWQWHFGEGLVRTPSNYGKLGERPTHPELLDYLAAKFVEQGWSIKALHRQIMLSATYQQSSRAPAEQIERDPENRMLARFPSRRLEAEAIRDSLLFVAGQLDASPGGPAGNDLTIARRSLYVQTARWDRGSYAILFDAANPDSSTERRNVSTVAPQALLLLNHGFVLDQAKHTAQRLMRDVPDDDAARIQYAYQLLLGRSATVEEMQIAQQILGAQSTEATWTDLAHVLLCCNEFVYVD